jgi:hypothetical protein
MSRRLLGLLVSLLALTVVVAECGGTEEAPASIPGPISTAAVPVASAAKPTEPLPATAAPATPIATVPTPPPATPTPTPTTDLPPHGVEPTPTLPESSGGEVEIRIPFDIYAAGEPSTTPVPECVNRIPFRLFEDGSRTMLEGEGPIVCHFIDTPQGSPITFHVLLEFNGVLDGELLPPTTDMPAGWLDAQLGFDGNITQYYEGYPAGATNPCPESDPCVMPSADFVPLPLAYEEGSTVTAPWIFVLHLW